MVKWRDYIRKLGPAAPPTIQGINSLGFPLTSDFGNAAFRDVGTTAGTVAAGNDERIVRAAFTLPTFAGASLATIPAAITHVYVEDRGAHFSVVTSEPPHDLKFQNETRWFQIDEPFITPPMAGTVGVLNTDDAPAFMEGVQAAAYLRKEFRVTTDVYLGSQVRLKAHTTLVGAGGTIYNQHSDNNYLGGLFVSDNSTVGGSGAPEIENISIRNLHIRDLLSDPMLRCTFFAIICCDGFVFEGNDIVKTSSLWTTFFTAKNARIVGNRVDSSTADIYGDCIHVMEGEDIVVADNDLYGEDDALAFYSHSYAESAYGNHIKNVVVSNNLLRSKKANSLRVGHSGETFLPNSAEFYVENLIAYGNVMACGVQLVDYRSAVTNLHKGVVLATNVIDERIALTSTVLAYDDITIRGNKIRAEKKIIGISSRAIDMPGGAVKEVYCTDNYLNWDNAASDNNVYIHATDFIEFSGNRVKGNSSGNGVSIEAPRSSAKRNDISMSAAFRSLWINNGASRVARAAVEGNNVLGTATNGIVVTNCDFAVVDGNDCDTTAPYGLSTVTAGSGRLFGLGAPVASPPNSYEWFRTDGGAGTTRYLRQGGAWVAM